MSKEDLVKLGLTEEQAEKVVSMVKADIDGGYVAKADFDQVGVQLKTAKEELKTRDKQLEELKKIDVEGLKAEIQRLQKENKANAEAGEAAIKQIKIDNAVEKALITAKAKNTKAVRALLELEGAELEGDSVKGLDKQIKKLMEATDSSFLFESEEPAPRLTGIKPAESGGERVKSVNDMNYTELCAYMEANPGVRI